ncbi:hypothetical protein NFI96_000517 [Prochilodus magdalenae]|nr:hypothetical protein NFI96_000517 [Prochilodus magdalenae]
MLAPALRSEGVVTVSPLWGEPVEAELCEEDPPPAEMSCEIACPGDCVVSSWSDWSSCSHSCTNKNAEGRQSRMRTVLALPGEAPGLRRTERTGVHAVMVLD